MNTEEKLNLAMKALTKIMLLGLMSGEERVPPNEQATIAYEVLGVLSEETAP